MPAPASPFFLSVDSPIDQAPSIDAVAAARLRGLNVTHVNHLMQQDSNRLADSLGLANVDAATIRRWQAECRLVCRVPQLRGFDARVLVGCGVNTPAQLASIHPVDLLQEVEEFLATERGRQILLSGSSHELSRITSWIAAGNSSSGRDFVTFGRDASGIRDPRLGRRSYYRGSSSEQTGETGFDSDRYEYDREGSGRQQSRRRRRRTIRTTNERDPANQSRRVAVADGDGDLDRGQGSGDGNRGGASRNGSASRRGSGRSGRTGTRSRRNGRRSGRSDSRTTRSDGGSTRSRRGRARRDVVQYDQSASARRSRSAAEATEYAETSPHEDVAESQYRFYLHRDSAVVDAPSIGNRMAERLEAIGIHTVDDLLAADAETLASELDHRRVDADTVLQWQQQAIMVCRVPMLRGHDAQLLVAAEVTTPEELAECDAEELFGIIDPIARSSEGKRIVRGGKLPDLEEVTDWIGYAQHQRELRAA